MSSAGFQTHPLSIKSLLAECESGQLQLPEFQRDWVWDEKRILSLLASISQGFPVGALMCLQTGGEIAFETRRISGVSTGHAVSPQRLLLDGQQRMTSLYQACVSLTSIKTKTAKNRPVERFVYADIAKALDPAVDREEALQSLPKDRIERRDFGREIVRDLSTRALELQHLLFPMNHIFDPVEWLFQAMNHYQGDQAKLKLINDFRHRFTDVFNQYQLPVITLSNTTTREAVCVVFEKVNTGGVQLDAFELVTAMYAADGHDLRADWIGRPEPSHKGRAQRLREMNAIAPGKPGPVGDVASTDFLQIVSLLYSQKLRAAALAAGMTGTDLPAISCKRQTLLSLPLPAYLEFQEQAELGFSSAAKFLFQRRMYTARSLPYQSQVTALAAVLANAGPSMSSSEVAKRVEQWFWSGVFGELYGSSIETRIARDFVEVPIWLGGGDEPTTVKEASFRAGRLETMRTRLSAAYKGVEALLMTMHARDFKDGQEFDHLVFFEENVDIHHIFPEAYCKSQAYDRDVYNSIVNKTPLGAATNRSIGGLAPSAYIARLERQGVSGSDLDARLQSHLIEPSLLRADQFAAFIADRHERLLQTIEKAMGKPAQRRLASDEDEGDEAATE